MLSRAFKSGNSIAVRIPQEIGVVDAPGDVEIERVGDSILIRLVNGQSLASVGVKFSAFPQGFMADGRDFHDEQERET
ncbi:MAG: AbrB/MazE/SpoVT family DNA-binding domain-containing protein [Methylococcaceae bacterium]|nr:AbrB/MazE/SpoVT family DNA-binding domain-containing protein [Methylococcaceae bacterium]